MLTKNGIESRTTATLNGPSPFADMETVASLLRDLSAGILQTAGEILPAGSDDVSHLITRLAQRFDVPTNVPHACSEQYERYARQLKR